MNNEFFEISFLYNKNEKEVNIKDVINILDLKKVPNKNEYKTNSINSIKNKKILLEIYKESRFIELIISIQNFQLHKSDYQKILSDLHYYLDIIFKKFSQIQVAVCSYELNAYFISEISSLNELFTEKIKSFPIFFLRPNIYTELVSKSYIISEFPNSIAVFNKNSQKIF